MLATRWEPFANMWSEMNRLNREMNRLFGRFDSPDATRQLAPTYPALDIWQDADHLYVEAELPGMALDDLEIYVSGGNQLSIKGERQSPSYEQATWHRRERGYGGFSRLVTLPQDVEADRVEAELKHGILTIKLPKREEAKPRRIAVKAQ